MLTERWRFRPHFPFASRRPTQGSAGDANRLKNPSGQNPLALAGRSNRARTCTPHRWTLEIRTAARDVVPDSPDATIWRDSGARVPVHASTCSDIYALQWGFSTAPECYGLSLSCSARKPLLRRVDTDRRPHRMLATCRPEKAARFVFDDRAMLRSRQCTLCGRSPTISDCHDP